ncbi:MAG: flagellar basal body-associated FliL family protein [Spirochaetaceae bacterium]|jgi:flagellar FliL protein|nr:flagellar basal body-associated FliL family protein [Spirochaetaceae bacterium]
MAKEKEYVEPQETEGVEGVQPPQKPGTGFLFAILKWVAIVIGAIILIVTVVIVTMRIMGANASALSAIPVSEAYVGRTDQLSWYTSIGQTRTKTSDATPATVIVDTVIGYKLDDKTASTEITARQIEIRDFLRRYFTEKTVEELSPRNEEKLRIEIRNSINDDILTTSKIRDVRFLTLDVIQQ